jgi:galactan beta-1,4-galactosyltransferase
MLPDWGYGRVYTVVVVNCTFYEIPNYDNKGGKLILHAYYSKSSKRNEKIVALEGLIFIPSTNFCLRK